MVIINYDDNDDDDDYHYDCDENKDITQEEVVNSSSLGPTITQSAVVFVDFIITMQQTIKQTTSNKLTRLLP